MHSFEQISSQFEQFLKEKISFPQHTANLYDPCKYILNNGGKRIRPALCLMSNELFGNLSEDAFYASVAVELFHNFTLIHDDIMDNASIRRGKTAVHEKYGLASGILSGDVMNIFAYEYLSKINSIHFLDVFKIYNKTAIEVCEGQQMDMDFEQANSVTKDDYLKMISLKTSVLLGMSLQVGAILNSANQSESELLYEFGKNLGIAFQLQDDYLDAFGTEKEIGKRPGGDIRSNKKTYLYLDCRSLADSDQNKLLDQLLNSEDENLKVNKTVEVYKELGVDKLSRELIEDFSQKAFSCLRQLRKSETQLEPLLNLGNYLLHRGN